MLKNVITAGLHSLKEDKIYALSREKIKISLPCYPLLFSS